MKKYLSIYSFFQKKLGSIVSLMTIVSMIGIMIPLSVFAAGSSITISAPVTGFNVVNASGAVHAQSADIDSNWTVSVNWGDGSATTTGIVITNIDHKDGDWASSHTYLSAGTFTVNAYFLKSGVQEATISTSVIVTVPPDTTPPVISEVTPVSTPTNDTTPNYTFTTNEAGTITYGGSCSSATTAASVGSNTITFNTLAEGTYSNCTIKVTDAATVPNQSNVLTVTPFTIDITAPIITVDPYTTTPTNADVIVTASTNEGTLNSTSHTFTSNGSFEFTATDSAGNSTTVTVTITNIDKSDPELDLPSNMTVEATSSSGSEVSFSATATDNDPANPTVTCVPASGSTFPLGGPTTVDCSATDTAGNTSTDSFTITVEDTTAPIVDPVSNMNVETSASSTTVTFSTPNATDLVDNSVEVTCVPESGSVFSLGTTNVVCTGEDDSGNEGTSSFQVIVSDTGAPVLVIPGNMTVEATSSSGATVEFSATATDEVDGEVPVTCTPVSGSTFAIGETTVECSAEDSADPANTVSESFVVTVEDSIAPVIASHENITVQATDEDGAVVEYTSPSTTDAVDGEGVASCLPISGSTFPIGVTVVTCTKTDSNGNEATPVMFNVNVTEEPPTTGTLVIIKDVVGSDGETNIEDNTSFTVLISGVEFSDDSSFSENSNATFSELSPGEYSISENSLGGYELVSISPSATATITAGQTTTITIKNKKLEVEQVPQPSSGGGGGSSGSRPRTSSGQVLGASVGPNTSSGNACMPYLTSFIKLGENNNVDDVKKLQTFLNTFQSAGLPVTGFYGPLTFAAVKKFQLSESEKVLKPWSTVGVILDLPTGYVYKTTQWRINVLNCPGGNEIAFPILP